MVTREHIHKALAALLFIAWVVLTFLCSCQTMNEEHIRASADSITFSRVSGRKAATGGFVMSRDSIVMRETK